jgi:hypothetical protein
MLPRSNQSLDNNYTLCFDKGHCLQVENVVLRDSGDSRDSRDSQNSTRRHYDVICNGIKYEKVVSCLDFHLEDTARVFNTTRKTTKIAEVDAYKKELFEKSCHPKRFLRWCIDHEEQKELCIS